MAVQTVPQEITGLHTISASETTNTFIKLAGPATGQTFYAPSTVRVLYHNAQVGTSTGTLQFAVQLSYNRGASWTTATTGTSINLSTTGAYGEQQLIVQPTSPTDCGEVWCQVLATLTGSSPSVSYRAGLVA